MDVGLREAVRRRAHECCEYCHLPESADPLEVFHLEHVVAKQHGGGDQDYNLAWACGRCNRRKGTNLASIDPETDQRVSLFNPRADNWTEHFSVKGAYVVGLTAAGRATARLLDMNSFRRIGVRRRLIRRGRFPIS